MTPSSRRPALHWWFTGLAALLVASVAAHLALADRLNSNTPFIGEACFAAAAALPLTVAGLVLELGLAARRSPPPATGWRAVHWATTGVLLLAGLYVAAIALLTATFPTC
jgi:hypothetical protein